jgi:hypothetical protein
LGILSSNTPPDDTSACNTRSPKYKDVLGISYITEPGCLAQGIPGVRKGTNTIVFIIRDNIPFNRLKDVTYERICANYRPKKDDPNCSRLTIGGDRLNVPKDSGTPTVDMVTVKLHLNSVISTKGAHYCTTLTSKISTS